MGRGLSESFRRLYQRHHSSRRSDVSTYGAHNGKRWLRLEFHNDTKPCRSGDNVKRQKSGLGTCLSACNVSELERNPYSIFRVIMSQELERLNELLPKMGKCTLQWTHRYGVPHPDIFQVATNGVEEISG